MIRYVTSMNHQKFSYLRTITALLVLLCFARAGVSAADFCISFPPDTQLHADVQAYPGLDMSDPNHPQTTPASWLGVTVGPNAPLPAGLYPAWCVDESHFIPAPISSPG